MAGQIAEDILKEYGGLEANDFIRILEQNDTSEDEIICFNNSNYYNSSDLGQVFSSHKNDFSTLSLNIQSIQSKFDSFISYLAFLQSNNVNFSAICFQETWLGIQHDTSPLEIPGYQLITQPYKCSSHGGLAIYLSVDYTYKLLSLYETSEIWEGLFIEVTGDNLKRKITLGNIYRPPRFNNSNEAIERFTNEMHPIINTFDHSNNDILITGDFNIDLLKTLEREKYQEHLELFMSHGLFPQLTFPTRFARKSCSLIDQMYFKSSDSIKSKLSGIIISRLSDHLPYFTCLETKPCKTEKQKFIKVFNNSTSDITNFCEEVCKKFQSEYFDKNLYSDPNKNYETFQNILTKAKDKCIPMKVVKANKYKHKLSPWITSGIIHSIKFRDNLYKKLKSLNPHSEDYKITETNLNSYNLILKRSIRLAKTHYYKYQFEKYKNDIRKTWGTIKHVLNKHKKSNSFPSYFLMDGMKITNKNEIAENFNKFFTEIGPSLSNKIVTNSSKAYKSFLTDKIACSFDFKTVTVDDVLNIIKKIKPKSSSGHDKISSILLKRISNHISPTLALIINQSLLTGIFPDKLKIAQVMPLYKKDNPHIFDNYRPISLLPVVSKIFEKIVYIQLYDYMVKNQLLYKSQYGFRQEHSTELATLEFTDRVMHHLDNKKIPITIFLDLSKAFDTLDHSILLDKLHFYGIKNTPLNWFKSYLSKRCQYVDFNGTESSKLPLTTGVPQGSILGPLMFIIYMNDIYKVSNKFHSILYADDTTLESPLCTFDTSAINHKYDLDLLSTNINTELNLVYEWLCLNKLSLNIKKTKFMIFHNRQRNINSIIPNLHINNHFIERVTNFNFLGVTLDQHMSWDAHINKISSKISRTAGILSRLKRYLPREILFMIYNALIVPHIQYGILCWGHKCNRIWKLQKRALRFITNSKYNAHTEPLHKILNCLNVPHIYKLNILKFYYKVENNSIPHYFKDMFTQTNLTHDHNTRFKHLVDLNVPNTAGGSYCIRYALPKILKDIPCCITEKVSTHSAQGFSNYIKKYFIKGYYDTCTEIDCYVCNQEEK